MKNSVVFIILTNVFFSYSQVGIGTTNPQQKLDVRGSIQMVDGNQGNNKILVSDSNGKATWTNINDGIKTRIIRSNGVVDPILWNHPEGIEVKFNTGSETVTITNNSGDSVNFWNFILIGDSQSASGAIGSSRYIKNFRKDGESLSIDLGNINSGWFKIIASDQNDEKDGFLMDIVYYGQDFNGTVQYWDE